MNEIKTNTPEVALQLIHYDQNSYEEIDITDLHQIEPFLEKPATTWIDIDGTHCEHTTNFLKEKLGLHALLIEDINQENHRPKTEEYANHIFIMVNMLDYDTENSKIKTEQVSFILGKNYLVSFQETGKTGDIFGPIRTRIKNSNGRHRKYGPDYLLYSLLDIIIDHYFVILEQIGERIEDLEDEVINQPSAEKLNEIYMMKRELILLRRSVWPLREVISRLNQQNSEYVHSDVHVYLRESYEHSIQVMETLESYRDILSGLIDIYLSTISNKMNSVMKVLTVISTIFMPLTFIVGLYGMNFKNMPELNWHGGYYMVLAICIVIAAVMLVFFKRKNWL
ncbi:MAG TPA: magnesium/cobalt transporter CorA [Cytophagaceae bacterium]|nr:magnesium/cobalt transporter CorA [Cytophagaceae bacterium]